MEIKNDEFQTLRLKVDQISSELDKQHAIRAVNTKWMIIVGSLIIAMLGFTSFIQIPKEAKKAAKEEIGPKTIQAAKDTLSELILYERQAEEILSNLKNDLNQHPGKNGYTWVGSIKFVWGTRESTKNGDEQFCFNPNDKCNESTGKSDEFNFTSKCFTVITSLAATSGRVQCAPTLFTLNRVNDYGDEKTEKFTFVAIGD